MSDPRDIHFTVMKRLLRYIKGTLQFDLTFYPSSKMVLNGFSDADWAGCPDDRRSTHGYSIFLGPNLISWASKKQRVVARSSTESEYRGLAAATAELTWLQHLLRELGVPLPNAPKLGVIICLLLITLPIQYFMLELSILNWIFTS